MTITDGPRPAAAPAMPDGVTGSALALDHVSVRAWEVRAHRWRVLLQDVSWAVDAGEHWAVLGPNGAGKTTLLSAVTGVQRPATGTVTVLGKPIGAPGMRDPRQHLGLVESTPRRFALRMSPVDVVLNGVGGSVAGQGRRVTQDEREHAVQLLRRLGCGAVLDRRYEDCSQGERQRVLIARALVRRPRLVLLDEPTTGLDLPAREGLLHAMDRLAEDLPDLATVTVTHHLEELAPSTTHALLLRDGAVVGKGPVDQTLTSQRVGACFGMAVTVSRTAGRWAAHSVPAAGW
jgi:iron complex transport system ATP-binding protein